MTYRSPARGDGGLDARVIVTVDGRAPGADEVDQLFAIDRGERRALGRLGEERCAATERKARTGEFTPPGISCWAREKRDSEFI